MPNGQSQLIDLKLIKVFIDFDTNSLLKENKALKNEILLLKDNISKNTNEISFLKNNIINLGKEMFLLKNENKKLWDEINNLKELNKNNSQSSVSSFDSKTLKSINEIDFILNYIRNNDKSFFSIIWNYYIEAQEMVIQLKKVVNYVIIELMFLLL